MLKGKMKALISQKDLKDLSSGVQRKVMEEAKLLLAQGYEVHIIAEKINKKMVRNIGAKPVKTFKYPFSGLKRRLFHAIQVQKYIDKNSFDLVIGHGDIIEQDICYIHNCVHLAHEKIHQKSLPADHEVGVIHSEILKKQKFKTLVCNSNLMKNDLITRFGIDANRVKVIYPEFNVNAFSLDGKKDNWLYIRDKYAILETDIVVGLITSGNFKKRNVELLIKTASRFPKNIKFLIAGKNKDQSYQETVNSLGLEGQVIFAPSIANVEAYYHAVDIFVLPAFIEEFGRSVLEAMSLKLPVVVGQAVGSSELLTGKSADYILKDLSEDELFSKLTELITSEDLRSELGELNQKLAGACSSLEQDKKLKNLIEDLAVNKEL